MPGNRLRPGEREERKQALAPMTTWMQARGMFPSRVIRAACARRGLIISRAHANQMRYGLAPAPVWLIEECCALLCVPVSAIYPPGETPAPVIPTRDLARRRYSGRRYTGRIERRKLYGYNAGDTGETQALADQPAAPVAPQPAAAQWTLA